MNEELMKSLVALIDESLAEIEELKKSDRFSASEIEIKGPGAGIAGKDPNGKLDKEEDKDEEDDEDEDEKEEDKAEKAEGVNEQADPNAGSHQVAKKEHDEDEDDHEEKESEEDKKKEMASMKKSIEETSSLMKSYVDERLAPIENQLKTLVDLVQKVADAPVPSKSVSYKGITPLKKSEDEGEELTKSAVVEKLFDLKKSGTKVDTKDIISAELGTDLVKIANKYSINK